MPRLIDADALESKAKSIYMEYENVVVPTRVIPISDLHLAPTIDAEPVRLRIDTVELNAEKGWYEKQFYCPCGQLIKTEMWDKKYCFGSGTVLKGNIMPKRCPNCGAKMDLEVQDGT